MDTVLTLKRPLEVNLRLCIFCQKRSKSKDDLREATDYSKNVVHEATTKRKKLRDGANREVIDRLEDLFESNKDVSIVWHGNCYAQYTSKEKIQRLQEKQLAREEL